MTKEKAFTWGGVALLILFIAFRPDAAAQVFKAIGGGIVDVATGFGDFVTNLISPDPPDPYEDSSLHFGDLDPGSAYLISACSVPPASGHKIQEAVSGYGTMGPVKSIIADQGVGVFGRATK